MGTIMAVDVGFVSSGVAVFEREHQGDPWELRHAGCLEPKRDTRLRLKSHDDMRRVTLMAKGYIELIKAHKVEGLVMELPLGGARGARANRCMALATGMALSVQEALQLPGEWYAPKDTREAAVPHGRGRKIEKAEVVEAMAKRWPGVRGFNNRTAREAVADALATFVAAEGGNLARML